MLGKMLLKTVLALAVVFVGMGLAVRYVGGHLDSWVHSPVDVALPGDVDGTWSPVHARHRTVQFHAGVAEDLRCRLVLGSYSVQIDHSFSFQPSPARPARRSGCAEAHKLRHALAQASRVSRSTVHGHDVLTFTADSGDTVVVLRKVGG